MIPVFFKHRYVCCNLALLTACREGHKEIVAYILNACKDSLDVFINRVDNYGNSALHQALLKGSLNVVELLHSKGADLKTEDTHNETALMTASRRGQEEIVAYILNACKDSLDVFINKVNREGDTALTLARTAEIEEMLLRTEVIDMTRFTNEIQLRQAVIHGNYTKIKGLLENHVDINARCSKGCTPLILAASYNRWSVIDTLLKHDNLDVNAQDVSGKTALMKAVEAGALQAVQSLMKAPKTLDLNKRDRRNRTALEFLLIIGDTSPVVKGIMMKELLTSPNIDLNAVLSCGKTALECICSEDSYQEMAKELALDSRVSFDRVQSERKRVCTFISNLDRDVWDTLLNTKLQKPQKMFSLMLLMADELDDQTPYSDFWEYMREDENMKNVIDLKDDNEWSIFHLCASSSDKEGSLKVLKFLDERYFDNLHEKRDCDGNTMLHIVMKNERYDVYNLLMEIFKSDKEKIDVHRCLESICKVKNTDDNTVFSIAVKSKMPDDDLVKLFDGLSEDQMTIVYREAGVGNDTLLHLSVKHEKHDVVEYISKQPVDLDIKLQNDFGYTALHVAVDRNDIEMVKTYYTALKGRNLNIDEVTSEKETAMHIAAKKGSAEMLKLLVDFGGDLAAVDEDGHTPLHDALQMLYLETEEDDKQRLNHFRTVWNTCVDTCVTWWCKKLNKNEPDADSKRYKTLRHEAMYELRSKIKNNNDLTVLEYAATLGLTDCVQIMLTERDVFVRRFKDLKNEQDNKTSKKEDPKKRQNNSCENVTDGNESDKDPEYEKSPLITPQIKKDQDDEQANKTSKKEDKHEYVIEVSNLMPDFSTGEEESTEKRKEKFIETLISIHPPMSVNGIMESFPMKKMTMSQWNGYQFIVYIFLVLHAIFMVYYTLEAQTSVQSILQKCISYAGCRTLNIGRHHRFDIIAMIIAIGIFIAKFAFVVRNVCTKNTDREDMKELFSFSEYVETPGDLLNYVTYLFAYISENFVELVIALFFFSSIVSQVLLFFMDKALLEYYAWSKGITVMSGWIMVLIIGRVYSPVFNFITALKHVFIKDVVPFFLFYIFLSIAFGCAVQLQFQLLSQKTIQEFDAAWLGLFLTDAWHVILELIIMNFGMDTEMKNVRNINQMFTAESYGTTMVDVLLILYALSCMIILLNMLIGAMSTTYEQVLQKQGKGWRQYQISWALFLRKLMLKITCRKLDQMVINRSEAVVVTEDDCEQSSWYIPVSKADLKEIRITYWKDFKTQ